MIKEIQYIDHLNGELVIPASKSHGQRVLALALLHEGETIVHGLGQSDDERAVLDVIQQCGAQVKESGNTIIINSKGLTASEDISVNIGESGLATRMLTPILANLDVTVTIEGHGSILSRPMTFFHEVFSTLGVTIESNHSLLPLKIKGPLSPTSINVDGKQSSQYITGLLYAFVGSKILTKHKLAVNQLKSRPYLELSLAVLKEFGVSVKLDDQDVIHFNGPYTLNSSEITIEGDWSSASFLIVAAALKGELVISNLRMNSLQSDKKILSALDQFGTKYHWKANDLVIQANERQFFNFDATHCPDLFPPLAVLAAFGCEPSRIKGITRLYHKESNRALTIQEEFSKLGIQVDLDSSNDIMIVHPIKNFSGGSADARGDHRIAMALGILGLMAPDGVTITNAEVVSKSFPNFFEVLDQLR